MVRVRIAIVLASVVLLMAPACSQKTDGNAAPPAAQTPPSSDEAEIELTAAQAGTGADASVMIPERRQSVTVKIPPGVKDGQRLRLKGMAAPASDGTPRDFFIRIHVK